MQYQDSALSHKTSWVLLNSFQAATRRRCKQYLGEHIIGGQIGHLFLYACIIHRYPESRLGKLFNGSIPIVLDSLKQHYFIDRDGKMFRHVLNFLRTGSLVLPTDFAELALLVEEARFYDIPSLSRALQEYQLASCKSNGAAGSSSMSVSQRGLMENGSGPVNPKRARLEKARLEEQREDTGLYQCLSLSISPDLGERVLISGDRALVEAAFPEVLQPIENAPGAAAWSSQDSKTVQRFPLNGFTKLNSLQAIERLLNAGFQVSVPRPVIALPKLIGRR
ncbi:BTB/POZ domain-containing protein KCTD1-like, partial [Tropilaelaps mercedesae]